MEVLHFGMEKIRMIKKIIAGLVVVLMFSGCAGVMKDAGEQFIAKAGLNNKVTVVCYDYWDKKDCPLGTLQSDLDVLLFIPGESRFCYGFTDVDTVMPEGMQCLTRDLVKD